MSAHSFKKITQLLPRKTLDFTIIPSYNKQYRTQGPNGQPNRWNPSPQQLAQSRQPYMSTHPQNKQNVRHQPLYLRQQFPLTSNPPINYEELELIHQKENQEVMDLQKQIAVRLNQMAEMLQKSICQQIQPQP
ncbi:hypothetical protein PIB30_019366 [Stylosanthes scabra]|uniref:Uncharacterized protein n=1 Tax=Stylosanthes scabra TaxID=79078 RepID=A0ABU6Y7U4_9FABA|nr:hypothetical protein [Stylosanthes scabra]